MNIIHINKFDGGGGGAQQFAFDLAQEFDAKLLVKEKKTDAENSIPLPFNKYDKLFEFLKSTLRKVGISRSVKQLFFLNEKYNLIYQKLQSLSEYKNADIVHLHNIHGGYFDLEDVKLIAKEKKVVWTLHDMWLMTGGEVYTIDDEGYKVGNAKTPYLNIAALNSPLIDRRQEYLEKKKALLSKCHENIVFVPVSDWLKECFNDSYVHNNSLKIKTIKNGVDTKVFYNKQIRKWHKPRVLFFNSTSIFKGSKYFHNILENISSDIDLYVVGNQLPDFQNKSVNTIYYKFIADRGKLADLYNNVDILVFPSIAENFPLTLLEASACGVSVVGANTGGIPEIINNENGYLFTSKDSNDLLLKFNQSIQDFELQKLNNAETFVCENFTFQNMIEEYRSLYKSLLKN